MPCHFSPFLRLKLVEVAESHRLIPLCWDVAGRQFHSAQSLEINLALRRELLSIPEEPIANGKMNSTWTEM